MVRIKCRAYAFERQYTQGVSEDETNGARDILL